MSTEVKLLGKKLEPARKYEFEPILSVSFSNRTELATGKTCVVAQLTRANVTHYVKYTDRSSLDNLMNVLEDVFPLQINNPV